MEQADKDGHSQMIHNKVSFILSYFLCIYLTSAALVFVITLFSALNY